MAIDEWAAASGLSTGRVFRSLNNKQEIAREQLLPHNIIELVVRYGKQIGLPNLTPHDLRRILQNSRIKAGRRWSKIQLSLGHATILTTGRYLGVRQDLQDAPCDHLGLKLSSSTEPHPLFA